MYCTMHFTDSYRQILIIRVSLGEDIRQVTNIQVGGRRKRGRPRQRWKDTVKSDMSRWGLEQEDVHEGPDGIL